MAKEVLDQYLKRIESLLADCGQWCRARGLKVRRGEITINEERHGQYQASTLNITDTEGRRIAEVIPFGESILGALGRVDLVGEYGKREKIFYLSGGGPKVQMRLRGGKGETIEESTRPLLRGVSDDGWYWVSPAPIRRAYPLTQEVFMDLLSAVSGHEF